MRQGVRRFWQCRKKQVLCMVAGVLLYGLAETAAQSGGQIADGHLKRGDYGDTPIVYDLVVEGIGEEALNCQAEIHPVEYGEEEARERFNQIIQWLPDRIKGENESLSAVRADLDLPSDVSEYGVRVSWKSDNPDILDSFGRIRTQNCLEEGEEVILRATLAHGAYEQETAFPVKVYPKRLTTQEQLSDTLQKLIQEEERKDKTAKEVALPREYEGQELTYREKEDKDHRLFLLLGPFTACLLYAKDKKGEEEKIKRRNQAMLLDYGDVVYQLMVFVGAGLTVGQAWERIVLNYKARREGKRCQERPAFEEMALALGQMQCGQPEGKAIMAFGKRCRIQSYLKLATLLEQNRRTGTKNLQNLLEQEMVAAWEQQKNVARRMGEEAGTKLLLPLFLMLFVVMVLVMVPAMMAMG